MNQNKVLSIFIGIFIFILLATFAIHLYTKEVIKSTVKIITPPKAEEIIKEDSPAIKKKRKKKDPNIPDNPADYGMIVHSPEEQPRNQLQWDMYMEKVLVKSKVLEQKEAQPALKKMQKSPEDYQKRKKEIDQRIATFEERLENDRGDKEAEKHIQALYMLKSMGKILEEKVTSYDTSDGSPPQIPSQF